MTKCDLLMISLFCDTLWDAKHRNALNKRQLSQLLDISCHYAVVAAPKSYFYNYMLIKV